MCHMDMAHNVAARLEQFDNHDEAQRHTSHVDLAAHLGVLEPPFVLENDGDIQLADTLQHQQRTEQPNLVGNNEIDDVHQATNLDHSTTDAHLDQADLQLGLDEHVSI